MRAICASNERRAYKGYATKVGLAADWRGLCGPESLRFDSDSVDVHAAIGLWAEVTQHAGFLLSQE